MKKLIVLTSVLFVVGSGCTTFSLERHTVNQIQTVSDYRYKAALHCLAMVAADASTLPSYALLMNGTTSITDTGIGNSMTLFTRVAHDFSSESLGFTGMRQAQEQWTVDLAADYRTLEATRAACRWVLGGPERLDSESRHILADAEFDPSPGPHFGVEERLERQPACWLHVGRLCDLPAAACYKAHCGDTWVWIMPDGLEGLANFTLVLQDIATLNVHATSDGAPSAVDAPLLIVTLWVVQNVPAPAPKGSGSGSGSVSGSFSGSITKGSPDSFSGKFTGSLSSATPPPNPPPAPVPGPGCEKCSCSATETFDSSYSPTIAFRVDRVIKPEFKCLIEQKINDALKARCADGSPIGGVDICWDQWMEWTTPYQGVRTNVKAGQQTTKSITGTPPSRALPSTDLYLRSLKIVETQRGLILPFPRIPEKKEKD